MFQTSYEGFNNEKNQVLTRNKSYPNSIIYFGSLQMDQENEKSFLILIKNEKILLKLIITLLAQGLTTFYNEVI